MTLFSFMTEGGEGRYCKLQPGTHVKNCEPSSKLYVCSSVSAWSHVGVLAALPLCGPRTWRGWFIRGQFCSSVNPSLPARFPCVCCSQPQAAPGLGRIPLRDHTLGIQMESTFSGVRLPHWKRVYRFSLMSSLLFFPDGNFLKQIWKLSKSWSSARILPQHSCILLSELIHGKHASEYRRLTSNIFYLQMLKKATFFCLSWEKIYKAVSNGKCWK